MKILCVLTGGLINDGITNSVLLNYKYMNKDGVHIDIVQNNNIDKLIEEKILQSGISKKKVSNRRNFVKYFIDIAKLVRTEKYDIIHVHGSSSLICLELMAAYIGGCKIRIAHSRNTTCSHVWLDKLLRPIFYTLCTERYACGQDAGKWLFGNKNFTILHNGKKLDEYKYSEVIRKKVRNQKKWENKIVIGNVGNFNYQKNHDFLIRTFKQISDVYSNAILVLIGKETEKGYLKRAQGLVKKFSLENKVVFMGSINNVSDMLQAMDIMFLPSHFEGLPNVVLEWQINGLPSIVSNTITRECAVTDLVKFCPINKETESWKILFSQMQISEENRRINSENACKKMKTNGFEIETNAEKLRDEYYRLWREKHE